ncbi:MAG: hypothetical protein IKQ72_12295 [Bacteroidaceae bacterium]|nr:hypothetical protein [Bacteroidaceae bacterium]
MALAIKSIPTLYGKEATQFREEAERVEREYDARPKEDITKDALYVAMKKMLQRSGLN